MPRRALYGFDPTRLTEVRRERGLSRSDLGRLSGVTYNTIRSWETGEGAPSPSALERVASVLDVAVSELAVVPDEVQTLRAGGPDRAWRRPTLLTNWDCRSPPTPVSNGASAR